MYKPSGVTIEQFLRSPYPTIYIVWAGIFQFQIVLANAIMVLPPQAHAATCGQLTMHANRLIECITSTIGTSLSASFPQLPSQVCSVSLVSLLCPLFVFLGRSLDRDFVAVGCGLTNQLKTPSDTKGSDGWSAACFSLTLL